MIDVQKITKSYGSLQVLKGIDLHIEKSEIVSILGASGAGKTTLLQIVGTLLKPDSGKVVIDGIDTFSLGEKKLSEFRNSHIGFVFQFHQLLPEFTALENVCIPAFIGGKGKKETRARAMELLEALNVRERSEHKPSELPGAEGINVEYITEDGDPSTLPTDAKLYQDNVDAIAGPACSYVDDTKEFSHWVMQTYNESTDEYEDIPNSQIFPGAPFPVLRDNAKMVFTYWCNADCSDCMESTSSTPPDDAHSDNFKARYTVKLRAEFVNETPKYTFAVWYTNDGSGDTLQVDGLANGVRTLGINETTIVIPEAPTRTGYIFKGWYKNAVTSGTPSTTDNQCTPNFLYYNNDNSRYYAESAYTTEVAKIAADIYQQTDYMYAVWEPELDFSFEPICPGSQIELPTTTEANVNLSGSWAASSGSIYGTTYTANNVYNGVVTLTFIYSKGKHGGLRDKQKRC